MNTTEEVSLRPLIETDLDRLFTILNDFRVNKTFIVETKENLSEFKPLFEKLMLLSKQIKPTIYGIEYEGIIVGIVSLPSVNDVSIEVGYAIDPNYQNRGIATTAFKQIIKLLFTNTCIERIFASFFEGNVQSERVMQKCGLTYSHININEVYYQNEYKNLVYYKLERENYHD